jgi:short-subunit dehydrogenase
MRRDLRDRSIIITGAGSGIGAATAVACAEAGMDVVLNGRREEKLEEVAGRVRMHGRRAIVVPGDVVESDATARLLDAAERELGGVDVVYANAGHGLSRTVVEQSAEELRRMFEVNFFAGVDLLRAGARHLLERERTGHLLMCSSCLSKFSLPRHSAYGATKAAQNAVCSSMRLELESAGIHVTRVHPITTTTEFFEVSAAHSGQTPRTGTPDHAPGFFTQPPERVARAIVGCLRQPCPEVWTSFIVRAVAGAMTVFPRFGDWSIRRQARKDE